jgi:hypothetical protein
MQRRTFFKLSAGTAATFAFAGGMFAWITGGDAGQRLTVTGREVMLSVGNAMLDTTLPFAAAARTDVLAAWLNRVDDLIGALPPYTQTELAQLFSLLGSSAGRRILADLHPNWRQASVLEVQAALQGMRNSSFAVRRQVYAALHDITSAAYFSDAATWDLLGYPGPHPI